VYVQVPLKHWTEGSGWEMAESLFIVVQAKTKEVVCAAPYFSITCDEVTTLVEKNNNQFNKLNTKVLIFFVDMDVLIWVFLNTKLFIF
jgi:hypothetical protein